MNNNDALNLLALSGAVNHKQLADGYQSAANFYQALNNKPADLVLSAINDAYAQLVEQPEPISASDDHKAYDYAKEIYSVLEQLMQLEGIQVEICGNWIWVTGKTKQHRKILGRKEGGIGCYFSRNKEAWYYRPAEFKSRNRKKFDLDDIRERHGSKQISLLNSDRQ